MAKKRGGGKNKQSESVSTSSARVLRPKKATNGEEKVDEKDRGKRHVEVDEKAKGKKLVAKGNLKINEAGNSENAGKRKVMEHEGNAKIAGKKHVGEKSDAGKKVVEKETAAKAETSVKRRKTGKDIEEAHAPSATKGSYSLRSRKGVSSEREPIAEKKGGHSLKVEATGQVQKDSEPTRKVVTRSAKKGHSELQKGNTVNDKAKDLKGKKILNMEEAQEDTDSDGDMVVSDIVKKRSLIIGSLRPKKNLLGTSKRKPTSAVKKRGHGTSDEAKNVRGTTLKIEDANTFTRKGGKSRGVQSQKRGNAEEETAGDASSSKRVSKRVAKSQTKTGGDQGSVDNRKNLTRKARPNAETN